MASQSDLAIRIATVMDAAGLRKADKGISGLEKSAKKLGKALGLALGGAALIGFGKSAIKAFAEDEAAAARLAQVVTNLGMAMELPAIEDFIGNMETATGVADDELRPAMQMLLTQFKDFGLAQQAMGLAVDVAAGSGESLATVVADITAAQAGNLKGLKKYKLGLTDAELKTKSFTEIMQLFNKQFKGSNAAYLDTYAGKMKVLETAAGQAKEIIGKGLVDALIAVTGAVDVQDLSSKMIQFAQNLADALVKVGNLIAENWAWVKRLGIAIIAVFTASKVYAGVNAFIELIKKVRDAWKELRKVSIGAAIAKMFATNWIAGLAGTATMIGLIWGMSKLNFDDSEISPFKQPEFNQNDPNWGKLDKQQIDQVKLQNKLLKEQNAIKKSQMIFDMNRIQIIAALNKNISEDERKRLELQMAIINEDSALASKLTYELAKSQGLTESLARTLADLPAAKNPFASWEAYLDVIEARVRKIVELQNQPPTPPPTNVPQEKTPGGYTKDQSPYNPYYGLVVNGGSMPGGYTDNKSPYNPFYGINENRTIVLNIDGKTVAETLANGNNSGYSVSNNRVLGNFAP